MKKFASVSTLLLAASAATSASALNLQGSDTLEKVVKSMVTSCGLDTATPSRSAIVYVGGGSGPGQNAMAASPATQLIAPMSREINGATCTANLATMAQLEIAKDAIVLVTAARVVQEATPENNATQCDNLVEGGSLVYTAAANAAAGTAFASSLEGPASPYVIADWKDTLKLAYFGLHHDGSVNANSDARWALLSSIRNLSNVTADCSGTLAIAQAPAAQDAQVTHLWRRDDVSGTTDTFKTLVGSGTTAFANGTDEQDNDPIRRVCQASDQVCGCDGKLGVVQAISVSAGVSQSLNYPVNACGTGKVGLKAAPAVPAPAVPVCLAGAFTTNAAGTNTSRSYTSLFNSCIIPSEAGSAGPFNCVNVAANRPFLSGSCDGRVWNKEVRNVTTGAFIVAPDNNKALVNAVFRIRPECTEQSSTLQIGCLSKTYPNSAGYAGFEATLTGAIAYDVHNIEPNYANVVTNFGTAAGYPIARKLFINTLVGETALAASTTPDGVAQNDLYQCFKTNTAALTTIINAEHFFGLDNNNDGAADYITNTANICP